MVRIVIENRQYLCPIHTGEMPVKQNEVRPRCIRVLAALVDDFQRILSGMNDMEVVREGWAKRLFHEARIARIIIY